MTNAIEINHTGPAGWVYAVSEDANDREHVTTKAWPPTPESVLDRIYTEHCRRTG